MDEKKKLEKKQNIIIKFLMKFFIPWQSWRWNERILDEQSHESKSALIWSPSAHEIYVWTEHSKMMEK